MRLFLCLMLLAALLGNFPTYATERGDARARVISNLQTMLREATAERDRLKTEKATVASELDNVKKELEQEKTAKLALENKLNQVMAAHKTEAEQSKAHLDNTTAKLREVIEKYNKLNKSKSELTAEQLKLQNQHQFVSSELNACEHKNGKMFEGAKEILDGLERCKTKGWFETLVNAEPVTQIKIVEFQALLQEYEDKLRKQRYRGAAQNPGKQ